jgi:AraC-like DNA-binding protein
MTQQILQFMIFAALGQILLICLVLGRDMGRQALGQVPILMWLAIASYLFCSDKTLLAQTGWFAYVLAVGSFSVPILLWATAQVLFIDEFRLNVRHVVSIVALLVIGYYNALASDFFGVPVLDATEAALFELTRPAQQFLNIGFMASAFYTAYRGRHDDLIDARRRFRMHFVVMGGGVAMLLAVIELSLDPSQVTGFHNWVGPPLVLVAGTWIGFWVLGVAGMGTGGGVLAELSQAPTAASEPNIEPGDQAAHRRLLEAFDEQHLYREHGLTIASLAGQIDVPEHHLRRLINKGLGFRNFSAFLNSYRLGDVVTAFSDPDQAGLPILTIALDAGFQSIATFNRAFSHTYGATPTSYRKQALKTAQ